MIRPKVAQRLVDRLESQRLQLVAYDRPTMTAPTAPLEVVREFTFPDLETRSPKALKVDVETKATIIKRYVLSASDAVREELSLARWSLVWVAAAAGVTAVATGGAAAFSNPAGLLTTAIAGVFGTAGVGASLKDSITSYFGLRAQASVDVRKMTTNLALALGPPPDDQKLDAVKKEMDDFLASLKNQAVPKSGQGSGQPARSAASAPAGR